MIKVLRLHDSGGITAIDYSKNPTILIMTFSLLTAIEFLLVHAAPSIGTKKPVSLDNDNHIQASLNFGH